MNNLTTGPGDAVCQKEGEKFLIRDFLVYSNYLIACNVSSAMSKQRVVNYVRFPLRGDTGLHVRKGL